MFTKNALLLILLLVVMNLSIAHLTKSISAAEVLLVRSIFNLGLVIFIAFITKKSILPKHPKLQLGSFICMGLGLLLVFSAYQYISAGSVSTLQRLDIPILAILAFTQKRSSLQKLWLSILALALVFVMIFYTQKTNENSIGYVLALAGVIVIAINTVIQKNIAIREEIVPIMVIVCTSSIFWGGIRCWQTNAHFQNLDSSILLSLFALAIINIAIFYLVNQLYKQHQPETVRYPYLISAFLTLCLEMILKQQWQNPIIIIGNILILLVVSLLIKTNPNEKQ